MKEIIEKKIKKKYRTKKTRVQRRVKMHSELINVYL
jgi:hypothetical protein